MDKKILISVVVILSGLYGLRVFIAKMNTPEDTNTPPSTAVTQANPASIFCTENGGTIQIKNTPEGQLGECLFPGGAICEEWSLLQGDCIVVGVNNTGDYFDGKNAVRVVYRIKTRTAILDAPSLGYENILLAQAISASGARYLSTDGTIEFWEHQSEGRLSVNGKEIFLGKLQ
ncbi:MAG: hypothetical protein ACD_81C00114G0002 [uncultured bacterium]|uniref:Hemolysin n=1 Tax=Candidatus Wolfebacteria bacterium GW2011_GWE2_44_13 TaxID=1619017 RepID=A0A0G1K705_9BACT|nr:MAG: hypothetical protein ACD_81C00114G0002 [uncultured bacterium]KKT43619.1 MAG: Hemolysin [Candidatus Wolfebacteria bacterium GW2011_GWE2_44_13]